MPYLLFKNFKNQDLSEIAVIPIPDKLVSIVYTVCNEKT